VLLNLLGNAIKFTHSGSVALKVERHEKGGALTALRFTVTDTGVGIPHDQLERVFDRFTQADSSTTRRFGGTGLGLTISKRLVELMGGRIWVDSEVGRGSCFAFSMPFEAWLAADQAESAPLGADPDQPLPALQILFAEDSADNCAIAMAYLQDTPYRIDVAVNGAIACEMFRSGRYDLVLMDRQMPVMDGLTATRTIRAWESDHRRAPTPIIALTASALKGDRETCLAAGCTAYLTKPIKQEVLLRAIRDHSAPRSVSLQAEDVSADRAARAARRLAEQTPAYLDHCRRDVIAIMAALDRADFDAVILLGHNLRGSGGGFGLPAITDFGAGIEQAATAADDQAARRWLGDLSTYLDPA
jgi:CheY-like chemotaxis protein